MIISGIYFKEQILSSVIPAGLFGFLLMILPLLASYKAKKEMVKLLPIYVYGSFFVIFIFGMGSMCPPYFIFPLALFGSIALFISVIVLRKDLGKKTIVLGIPIVCIFMMGARVPTDVYKAMNGEIRSKEQFFQERDIKLDNESEKR